MKKDISFFQETFNNKKVLITGHTGFKGSWLSIWLYLLGAKVFGVSNSIPTNPSHFTACNLEKQLVDFRENICDTKNITSIINDIQPDFIFHLAAQSLVKVSYQDPFLTWQTNTMGTVSILESLKFVQKKCIAIFITSDKSYDNIEWDWGYRENDKLGGIDPYSASKGSAEFAIRSYSESFFKKSNIRIGVGRAGNVIGGGDFSSDRIVPDFINSIKNNRPIVLRNPNATRPWQHVLEPISGYVKLSRELYDKPLNQPSSWNFGPTPQEVYTVEELTSILIDLIGSGSIKIDPKNITLHEAQLLKLNCDKANHILSWYPRWSVKKTIEVTADWYKVYLERGDLEEITDIQINDYFYT